MGFWSGVKSLFSVGDGVSKVLDASVDGLDAIVLTDEEEIQYNIAMSKVKIEMLKAYHPFKIAQRLLALIFATLFSLAFISGLIITLINIYLYWDFHTSVEFIKNEAGQLVATKELTLLPVEFIVDFSAKMGLSGIVMIIVAFYFGGGTIESFKGIMNANRG